MLRKIGNKAFALALLIPTLYLLVPNTPQLVLADITCENSDYNCIYVDTVSGDKIVCGRSVCGSGSFGGRTYRLEGLYAFDGVNPNSVTTTTAATTTSVAGDSSTSSTTTIAGDSFGGSTTTSPTSSTSSTTTVASAINPCLDPENPAYVCGWAVLDINNRVTGVIVCSFAVCGSGSFGGMRLVLQSQQMAGGNVAGWHGEDVNYDESSGSYTLPGGGTLKSGDKLEDAIFPKVVTVVDIVSPEVVETIAAPSGKLYENTNDYANAETETVVTSSLISVELPTFQVHELDYQVSFDPNGAEPEFLIASGKIVNDSISSDVVKQSVGSLRFSVNAAKNSSKIVLRLEQLRGKNGLLKLSLRKAAMNFAEIGVKINAPKKYSSCRALVKDYPGGVITSAKWTDKKTKKQKFDYYAKPTLNSKVFVLNQKLDFDKDKIVCEKNN